MTTTARPTTGSRAADRLQLHEILERQRVAFLADGIPDARTRIDRITRLQAMILDNADALVEALREDFGTRPRSISLSGDVISCMADLDHQKKHLASWMGTSAPATILNRLGVRHRVRRDPKGVVGVVGPWNFPVMLTVVPAGAAFAAGNRVMLRPSEITAHTVEVMADIAPDYFALEELAVITEAHGDGAAFTELPLDHLFFTGSPAVGALVAQAAGRNLVPVTLELGGKNPVVVDRATDVSRAARRVAASRIINAGQVCLCPDYVFVPSEDLDTFVGTALESWRAAVPTLADNDDYTSIINERNYDRVVRLVEDAVAKGATKHEVLPPGEGTPHRSTRKIPPTLLTGVTDDMLVAQEEIFGPVLAVHPYDDLGEAIAHVNRHPSPLTMYWYGDDNDRFHRLQESTRSGSVNANDFGLNMLSPEVPFGGVGRSGYGAYHGKAGFDTFSHARTVVFSKLPLSTAAMMAPPFKRSDDRMNALQLAMLRRKVARARRRT